MEKIIVINELSKKYGKSKILIKRMVDFALKNGFSLKETVFFIENFFDTKSMQ